MLTYKAYSAKAHLGTPPKKPKNHKKVRSWVCTLFIPLLLVITLNTFFIKLVFVDGNSMYPTLHSNDLVVVWQMLYTPVPSDVVLINSTALPFFNGNIVKRIIAGEGQTVLIDYDKNIVSVDNHIMNEPYLNYEQIDPLQCNNGNAFELYEVPPGCVFVLGDNRNFSIDSRDSRVGMIQHEDVKGRLLLIIPLSRILTVSGIS